MCSKFFEHGELVLVKNTINEYWIPAVFHSYVSDSMLGPYNVMGNDGNICNSYTICISHLGNEHLAGKRDYPFNHGDMVLMRNEPDEIWLPRIFHSAILKKNNELRFVAMGHKANASTEYKECAIYDEDFICENYPLNPETFRISTKVNETSKQLVTEPSIIEISNVKTIYSKHPDFTIKEISNNLNYPKSMVEACITKIKETINEQEKDDE